MRFNYFDAARLLLRNHGHFSGGYFYGEEEAQRVIENCFENAYALPLEFRKQQIRFVFFELPAIENAPGLSDDQVIQAFRNIRAKNPQNLTSGIQNLFREKLRFTQEQMDELLAEQGLLPAPPPQRALATEVHTYADIAFYRVVDNFLARKCAEIGWSEVKAWAKQGESGLNSLYANVEGAIGKTDQAETIAEKAPLFFKAYTKMIDTIHGIDWGKIRQTGCPSPTKENVLQVFFNGCQTLEVFRKLPMIVKWVESKGKLEPYVVAALGDSATAYNNLEYPAGCTRGTTERIVGIGLKALDSELDKIIAPYECTEWFKKVLAESCGKLGNGTRFDALIPLLLTGLNEEVKAAVLGGLNGTTSAEARKEILRQALVLQVSPVKKASKITAHVEAFFKNPNNTNIWDDYTGALENEDLQA